MLNLDPPRPIGFSPAETSALQNEAVVSQHAEEAAFLWTQRNRAVGEAHYSLLQIATLDDRVEAHLDGLRIAGDLGFAFAKENLANGDGPGELFTLAALAFEAGERRLMVDAVRAGAASARLRPAIESALGWLDYGAVAPWIGMLLQAKAPAHRSLGIAACALHRRDPGAALTAAVDAEDSNLRARALRAVGEIKRHDLVGAVVAHAREEDEVCRFWAAWSATMLRWPDGWQALAAFADRNDLFSERALQLCLRAVPVDQSRRWISARAKQPELARLATIGTGIVGDPISIPWLIRKMEVPDLARLAGEAFSMITGVDLELLHLDEDAAAPEERDDADGGAELLVSEYEATLPWPSAARVAEWWAKNNAAFAQGVRHLGGEPISRAGALDVLRRGKQRQRAAAAIELAFIDSDAPLFNVRGRGPLQERALGRSDL